MILAQITFTADQVTWAKDIFQILIVPMALWIFKSSVKKLHDTLNEIITDNTNRNRDELKEYFDKKFSEHEIHDDLRFSNLESRFTQCQQTKIIVTPEGNKS